MSGPKDLKRWLDLLGRRQRSLQALQRGGEGAYNLADFPRPQAFLNALRQDTAARSRIPLADLSLFGTLAANTGISDGLPSSVRVEGSSIHLQGALLDSSLRLQPANANSESTTTLSGDLIIGWGTEGVMSDRLKEHAVVPLYVAPDRQTFLLSLSIPSIRGSDPMTFSMNGVACFLMDM
ncbi:unnamed protein product [Phytomonas sp. Hart1]|nr:unnamed protein product [Phytomonas sp. Hart1]|eukprot:CCW71433.1 unnamed protein product [Phytomonas sp. isolate Hart1]